MDPLSPQIAANGSTIKLNPLFPLFLLLSTTTPWHLNTLYSIHLWHFLSNTPGPPFTEILASSSQSQASLKSRLPLAWAPLGIKGSTSAPCLHLLYNLPFPLPPPFSSFRPFPSFAYQHSISHTSISKLAVAKKRRQLLTFPLSNLPRWDAHTTPQHQQ